MTALKINNIINLNKISKLIRSRLLFKPSELDVQYGSSHFDPAVLAEPMVYESYQDDEIVDTFDNENENLVSCYQEMTLMPAGFTLGGFLRRLWKHRDNQVEA